ncbi:MAG: restriction endonuclease subunit S, partial [Candidatus Kuenenbacteria bacterium]
MKKTNWKIKKLSELSKRKDAIVSGPFGSNLKVSDYKTEGVPILRLQNIGKGIFIDKDIKYISKIKAEELKYHSFVSGDISLAKLGIPIGKTCTIPNHLKSGIITADVVRIRADKNIINYDYLEYFLNSDISVNQLTSNISGTTRPRVNLSDVRNIKVSFPSLQEQKRIVKKIDKAFKKIELAKKNTEKKLQNSKELFESYLSDVFTNKGDGWKTAELNKHVKFIDYRGRTPKKTLSGIRLITAKNIKKGFLQRIPEEFIHPDNYETWMTRGIPHKGDVLFTTEAPLANVAQLDTDKKVAFAQRTIIFQPDLKKINQ